MTANTDSSTTAPDNSTPPATDGRVLVLISIAVVAILFVGMVGLLYWHERPAPSALLVLRVPLSQDGAVATVNTADGRDLSPIVKTLQGGQEVRIPLPPGEYTVRIEHKSKGLRRDGKLALIDYSYFPIILEDPSATHSTTQGSPKH
jgi:hypothetical protein